MSVGSHAVSIEPVDVLILTAADGEDEAVRQVDEGAVGTWLETPGQEGFGFSVWTRSYRGANGQELKFALVRAFSMGGDAASNVAGRLVDAYKPQCLAMSGVCAGNPERAKLGDVIIADRVWRFDQGEVVRPKPRGPLKFLGDVTTYNLREQWKQLAERFAFSSDPSWRRSVPGRATSRPTGFSASCSKGATRPAPLRSPRCAATGTRLSRTCGSGVTSGSRAAIRSSPPRDGSTFRTSSTATGTNCPRRSRGESASDP